MSGCRRIPTVLYCAGYEMTAEDSSLSLYPRDENGTKKKKK